jgi:phospholipase/carboxylesterase
MFKTFLSLALGVICLMPGTVSAGPEIAGCRREEARGRFAAETALTPPESRRSSPTACAVVPVGATAAIGRPMTLVPARKERTKRAMKAVPDLEPSPSHDLSFVHHLYRPEKSNGETMVLLHGSGGDETSLVWLASRVAPHAVLLGVRGRVIQDGIQRWYRRLTPVRFDQKDVRAEATAFAGFLSKAAKVYDIDFAKTVFLGYSNGANLLAVTALLYPELVKRAALLRPMPVLDDAPKADLRKAQFLTVAGTADETYAPFAPALAALLRKNGADVEAKVIKAGHLIGRGDERVVSKWLSNVDGLSAQVE